jgi:hypothetical protein
MNTLCVSHRIASISPEVAPIVWKFTIVQEIAALTQLPNTEIIRPINLG